MRRFWISIYFLMLTAAPVLADDAMPYSPIPQVSLSLPKGWTVCDKATGTRTGNAADPEHVIGSCSARAEAEPYFLISGTDLMRPSMIFVILQPSPSMNPAFLDHQNIDPHKVRDALCAQAVEQLDVVQKSCDVQLVPFAGARAAVGHLVGHMPNTEDDSYVPILKVPYTGGMLTLLAIRRADKPDPGFDQVIESVTVR
jgi:hypothetical protein